jgi:hypothetical protein
LVVWAGAADIILNATTPRQAFSYLEEYCKQRRRVGWKVIVGTMISAVDNDANKNTYNALIRSHWTEFADGLADIASNANLGADGAYSNTTYFNVDQIHLTDTGYALIAPIVQAAIETVNTQATTLANGATATTQSQADNSTKLATTAYVDTGLGTKKLILTAQNTPSAAATSSITGLSPNKRYKLIINILQNTSNGVPYIQFNTDTGNNYKWVVLASISAANANSGGSATDRINIHNNYSDYLLKSGGYYQGEFYIDTQSGDNTIVLVNGQANSMSSSSVIMINDIIGYYDGASNLSSILIGTSAGTITGTITLYEMQ